MPLPRMESNGFSPNPVIFDGANLYGTVSFGGSYGLGTVIKVSPSGHETILHNFAGAGDGILPAAGLVRDSAGNLYGTTAWGGANGVGTVFKVTLAGDETVLHSFAADGIDGYFPDSSLVFDKAGNLYGTTNSGGTYGLGTVFKITP